MEQSYMVGKMADCSLTLVDAWAARSQSTRSKEMEDFLITSLPDKKMAELPL